MSERKAPYITKPQDEWMVIDGLMVMPHYCAICAANRSDGHNGNHDGTGDCEHKRVLRQMVQDRDDWQDWRDTLNDARPLGY